MVILTGTMGFKAPHDARLNKELMKQKVSVTSLNFYYFTLKCNIVLMLPLTSKLPPLLGVKWLTLLQKIGKKQKLAR